MKKIIIACILISTALLAGAQQSYTVEGPRTVRDLNALNVGNHYTFFNLSTNSVVDLADSNSTNWDIAFRTTTIILNGGTSGPGTVAGKVISGTSFSTLDELPTSGYTTDASTKAIPTGSGNGWYNHNPSANTITPITDRVIAIQLANGDYVKLEILSYYLGAPENPTSANTARQYTFRYQISSANDFSSLNTTVTNLRADLPGNHYQFFNLADADTIPTVDSASTKWDIAFRGTTLIVNSGTSGPSTDQAQVVVSGYDSYLTAPSAGWNSDNSAAIPSYAIPTGSGNGWYLYDPSTHVISANTANTILVKTADGKFVKIKIESYYKDGNTSSATKYYTFSYFYQPYFSDDLRTDVNNVTTGLLTPSVSEDISVYPQPLSLDAQVVMIDGVSQEGQVMIYNTVGELVYATTMNHGVVELSGWNKKPGCYVLKCISNYKASSQRIVIQ